MFGLGKLVGAVVDLALTPVELVKDVATMGGDFIDGGETNTGKRLRKAYDKVSDAADELAR
jgi:hypothetical protein